MSEHCSSGEGAADSPFIPTEEWIEAFELQYNTPEFHERAERYALRRASLVALSGRKIDAYFVTELVQDVIDDTLFGKLAWNPERVTLIGHVCSAIQISNEASAPTRKTSPAHEPRRHGARVAGDVHSIASFMADAQRAETAEVTTQMTTALRALASDDADVLLLVDALAVETKRVDVLRMTAMTPGRYDAARKRLERYLQQLPDALYRLARNR